MVPLEFDGSDAAGPTEGQQCLVEANALTGMPYREALLRQSETESDGQRLGGPRLAEWLPAPSTPTLLVVGGSADSVEPSWDLRDRPDVRQLDFPFSGHLPFVDRREEFLTDLLDFYDLVDETKTSRSGLTDGRS